MLTWALEGAGRLQMYAGEGGGVKGLRGEGDRSYRRWMTGLLICRPPLQGLHLMLLWQVKRQSWLSRPPLPPHA
jgi:hypothetical protein